MRIIMSTRRGPNVSLPWTRSITDYRPETVTNLATAQLSCYGTYAARKLAQKGVKGGYHGSHPPFLVSFH